MVTRVKTHADVTKEEILSAVEEAYDNGIMAFKDAEVSRGGEPTKRVIKIESVVTL